MKTIVELVKSDVAEGATNTPRPLTHSLDQSKEGLAVDATQTPEEWRPVVGYEGLYDVSDLGRVRTLRPGKKRYGSLLRPCNNKGYLYVSLTITTGNHRWRPIHQLVLEAFVGPCPFGMETRHINDVPDDNRLVNLAWGTRLENRQDCARNGRSRLPRLEMWNR